MGLIVDDHDKGIHGELRRESFAVYSDLAEDWHVELDLDKLDELLFVLREIKRLRDEGEQYPQHKIYAEKHACSECLTVHAPGRNTLCTK